MKKLISTVLAVTLTTAVSATAFATDITADGGSQSQDVTAQYVAGAGSATVYSVDVVWDSMQFTYTAADGGTWNPERHEYVGATQAGTWAGEGTITVTNHSNTAMVAELSYTKANNAVAGAFDKATLPLATAVGTAVDAAPTASAELTLSGVLSDGDTNVAKVGSVTVTLSSARA